MRGIVSLAAALSIPFFVATDLPFPHRDLIFFITYCVIVVTLLVPALTLPVIIHMFHFPEEDAMKQEAMARIRTLQNSIKNIELLADKENIPCEMIKDFLNHLYRRLDVINTQLDATPYSTLNNEYLLLRKLMLTAITSERHTLFELRKAGEIHEEVFHRLADELDFEEMRARSPRL